MSDPLGFLEIRLYPRETECICCGDLLVDCRQGVPMYEGMVLPNDWEGEWYGFDSCSDCFEAQGRLTRPVYAGDLAAVAKNAAGWLHLCGLEVADG